MIELFKKLKKSYHTRIILVFIGGMLFLAVGLDLLFIHVQRNSYTEHTRQSGLAVARLLAQAVQVGVFAETVSVMSPVVESLLLQEDIQRVVILNGEEEILLDRRLAGIGPQGKEDCLQLLKTVRQEGNNFLDRDRFFVFWWPVMSHVAYHDEDELYFWDRKLQGPERKFIGWVGLFASKEKFEVEVRHLILRTAILVLAVLVLAISCTLFLLNKMMNPLRDLVGKVVRLEKKEEVGDKDEISLLDATYSRLLERLELSFATIDELRQNLEEKVKERTSELALANEDLENKKETLKESNASLERALTEIKEAQAQLIQSEKMAALGQLVAGVAHEVNNNINFIVTATPALEKLLEGVHKITDAYHEAGDQETDVEMLAALQRAEALREKLELDTLYQNITLVLGSIHEGCSRSVKIVNELTSFSRQESDHLNEFDVNEALLSTWKFVDNRYKDNVELVTELGDLPQLLCSGGRITQVFLNIMNNSVQAMGEEGGTLTLTTSGDEEMVHIRFGDTGYGIAKEDLPRIFDPFFTRKEVGQGTGLGLGICYKIIAEHHGKIRVESGKGRGTAITVSLPIQLDTTTRPECELSLLSLQ